jgi:hypothetical protein
MPNTSTHQRVNIFFPVAFEIKSNRTPNGAKTTATNKSKQKLDSYSSSDR